MQKTGLVSHRFIAVRQMMFFNVKRQLWYAEILPGRRYHKDGAMIVRDLWQKGSISDDTYYGLVDADTGDKLLETNVFAFHVNSGEITFQWALKKRYCEENSALWSGWFSKAVRHRSSPSKTDNCDLSKLGKQPQGLDFTGRTCEIKLSKLGM